VQDDKHDHCTRAPVMQSPNEPARRNTGS
jgi:hypothetical protein